MLNKKKCVPCQGGIDPLKNEEISIMMQKLPTKWTVKENKKLIKEYTFNSYKEAVGFAKKIAVLSEEEGHHPYIHINYKTIKIIMFTHKINGLHENDFIIAAKCDEIHTKNN